jgi:hypothetical protein
MLFGLCGRIALAQDKVAEGEYQMRGVGKSKAASAKNLSRWVLYSKPSGGYHLESEIQAGSEGARIIQSETIRYDFYEKDQKQPVGTTRCGIADDSITCSARIEGKEAAPSKPFKHDRPFLLMFDGLYALDMPWLLGGGISMSRLEKGEVSLATILVAGGDDDEEWEITVDEEEPLKFVGNGTVTVGAITIAAKSYVYGSAEEPIKVWITDSGIPVKMVTGDWIGTVLANYKQYKKLIPELPVENDQNKAAH